MAARRSPARFLAPIALVAFAFALYSIVKDAREPAGGSSSSNTPGQSSPATGKKSAAAKKKAARRRRKTYVVKAGDTPSGIAAKTGVSLATLQKLNRNLNPQALQAGQRLRLSR
jgi:LysM repeat protein